MVMLTLEAPNAEIVRKGLQDLGAEIPLIGRQQIYKVALRIRSRMRKPGKAISYPVNWDSQKQRRAYFAKDGFGRGIPYIRTNEYVDAWEIVSIDQGYAVQNTMPHAKYIAGGPFGGSQSKIHQDRWELFRPIFEEETERLPEDIRDEFEIVARRMLP